MHVTAQFHSFIQSCFRKGAAEFVANVRIAEARRRLEIPRNNIDSVATSVGFRSADAFSRAFEREVGCRPSTYRARRGTTLEDDFPKQRSELVEPLLAHA